MKYLIWPLCALLAFRGDRVCDCYYHAHVAEALATAGIVVHGKIIEIGTIDYQDEEFDDFRKYYKGKIKIINTFKSTIISDTFIFYFQPPAFYLSRNREYIFYGYAREDGYYIPNCISRTRPYARKEAFLLNMALVQPVDSQIPLLAIDSAAYQDLSYFDHLLPNTIYDWFFMHLPHEKSPYMDRSMLPINPDALSPIAVGLYGQAGVQSLDAQACWRAGKALSAQDVAWMQEQLQAFDHPHWWQIGGWQLVVDPGPNPTPAQEKVLRAAQKGLYSYSAPLFSMDGRYAVCREDWRCGLQCYNSCICLWEYRAAARQWRKIAAWNCVEG